MTYGELVQSVLINSQDTRYNRISFDQVEALSRKMQEIKTPPLHPYEVTARISASVIPELLMRAIELQAVIDNARVAIALERHHLRHGVYPEALDVLYPEFLDVVPVDRVTGESLRYFLRSDGRPCVYSVGINRTDDDGLPRNERELGDWVWQYSMPDGFHLEGFYQRATHR
ncbi:MAG: hypothetical protein O3C21_15230 [Verrucomicrobia bacterium]|nr:hypothetical protein [Verrucomicrobiota bacterium]